MDLSWQTLLKQRITSMFSFLFFFINFFRVSSLAYPNLLGKKGYVVVVVVLAIYQTETSFPGVMWFACPFAVMSIR